MNEKGKVIRHKMSSPASTGKPMASRKRRYLPCPPAIPGLGASGGLQLQLEDRKNLGPTEMQHAIQTLLETYRTKPQLLSLSSMYQANVPQYRLNIDRDKVQLLGLQLSDVFSTLSYYMGAAYVNDFVEFGRIYQVKIEAGGQAQKVIDDVMRLSLENSSGKMVPFSAFTEAKQQLGLDQINLYNMYSSASITCIANPKYSSGEAIQAMEELIQEQLGDNFGYEWTSVAYQETKAGSTTMLIFGMALLVAFLVLSAQYESWTSPLAAIMGLPIALLGAILGCFIMGVPVSVYTQIGIILLIALSAKNGILIVEFARDYRAAGNPIREAALEAGHVRLRPILMTSFAFVLGVSRCCLPPEQEQPAVYHWEQPSYSVWPSIRFLRPPLSPASTNGCKPSRRNGWTKPLPIKLQLKPDAGL